MKHHSHLNVSNNNRLGICESLSTGTFSFTLSFTVKLTVTSIGKVIHKMMYKKKNYILLRAIQFIIFFGIIIIRILSDMFKIHEMPKVA